MRYPFIFIILFICFNNIAEAGSNIRVVQISDVQLGFTESRAHESGVYVEAGIDERYFEKAVASINSLSPRADVVINTGDLIHNPDDESAWQKYLGISKKINAPVYEVMGNHDGWSADGILAFNKRFHHNDYYSFLIRNCRFIVLNSWYLKDPAANPEESAGQKEFLEQTLKTDQSAFRIILLHFPLFIDAPSEADAYFNLPSKERKWLLDLAVHYNVKLILSGHSHRNILHHYKDSVTLITTGPVSEPLGLNGDKTPSERGYRIIDIDPSKGTFTHRFIKLDSLKKTDFSFDFLGDLHFDRQEHHNMEWVLKNHPGDTTQIRGYCEKTMNGLPALYNDIRLLSQKDISLVVQSGDFTEGLCGDYHLAERQMKDFINFTTDHISIPFLMAKGNHDITGPGADSAYQETILPFLERQTQLHLKDAKYVYIKNQAAFFFYDSYDPESLPWLKEQLKKYRKIPVKFVVMHEPVVPINARSKWTEFSAANEKKQHQMLLELLGKSKAIVLAGHLHAYGFVLRKTHHGQFIQLSGSSVIDNVQQNPKPKISNTYGPELVDMEPNFSPGDREERKARLAAEEPFIRYYEYAVFQGHMVIHVEENLVTADLYNGVGLNKFKTIDISGILNNYRR